MKKYFTVGPSQIYPTVPQHVITGMDTDIMSLSHRSEDFKRLFQHTVDSIKQLLNIPENYTVLFLSSATECWERILENCVVKDTFHVVSGAFSTKFYEASVNMKKKAQKYEFHGQNFKPSSISQDCELITMTHNETNNGIMIPMDELYRLKLGLPRALIALDMVSSTPYVEIDFKYIDCTFFSVQKGFGLPAGLAVLILSPAALQKARDVEGLNRSLTVYRRFSSMKTYADKQQTFETPNVLYLYLFSKVVKDMLQKGIKTIREETQQKAQLLYTFLKSSPRYSVPQQNPRFRSQTVIVANVKHGSAKILTKLKDKGFIVGGGYEKMKDHQIRIANFPAHSVEDVEELIELL